MDQRILVTRSVWLVGTALCPALATPNCEFRGLDTRAKGSSRGDVRNEAAVANAVAACERIIHLAAVWRVAGFIGCPERARTLLGRSARLSVRDPLQHLTRTLGAAGSERVGTVQ